MRQGKELGRLVATENRPGLIAATLALVMLVAGILLFGSASPAAHADGVPALKSASPAKKKALVKCNKIRKPSARKTCRSQVNQKFLPPRLVDVRDDFFFPETLTIRSGRRITWDWGRTNGNSHNVMLDPFLPQPKSLTRADFFRLDTGQNHAINYRFTRDLTKAGDYNFYCSLHSTVMRMKVKVTR